MLSFLYWQSNSETEVSWWPAAKKVFRSQLPMSGSAHIVIDQSSSSDALIGYSNREQNVNGRCANIDFVSHAAGRVSFVSGHLGAKGREHFDWLCEKDHMDLSGEELASLPGQFLIGFRHCKFNRIVSARFFTDSSRSVSLYIASTNNGVFVSDRFIGLMRVLQSLGEVLTPSRIGISAFLSHGFYPIPLTPFKEIRAIGVGHSLSVSGGQARYESYFKACARKEHFDSGENVDSLANDLVDACSPLSSVAIELGLSGGRDSRLIAAGLRSSGVQFSAFTKGSKSSADVILGGRVAKQLGIQHRVIQSSGRGVDDFSPVSVDPVSRIRRTLRATDGMVSGYDGLNAVDEKVTEQSLHYSGGGGPHIKGGLNRWPLPSSEQKVHAYIQHYHRMGKKVVFQGDSDVLESWLDEYVGSLVEDVGVESALDWFYLDTKSGAWSSGVMRANPARLRQDPLADNRLVYRAYQSLPSDRSSELLYFKLLSSIAPSLCSIPFTGRRLKFESSRPFSGYEYGWQSRAPIEVLDNRTLGQFNWRFCHSEELWPVFKHLIDRNAHASVVSDIIDFAKIKRLVESERAGQASRLFGRTMWAVISVLVFFSEFVDGRSVGDFPLKIHPRPMPLL